MRWPRLRESQRSAVGDPKGTEEAKRNLFEVPLAGSTITHTVTGITGGGKVLMKPAAPGTGVIAGGAAHHS